MDEFLHIALHFPTALLSLLLLVVLAYWIFVLLGALDLDLFDLDADLDADLDVDVDVDAGVDADAGVEVGAEGGAGAAEGAGALVSVLMALGWTGVPLTITLSIFIFMTWIASFLGTYAAQLLAHGLPALVVKVGVTIGAGVTGVVLTRVLVWPLRKMLKTQIARKGADHFVGKTVRVTSMSVTPTSGRGSFTEADGAHIDVAIRCEEGNNSLQRGDEALIIGYDADKHLYYITPMSPMRASGASEASQRRDVQLAFDELERQERAPGSDASSSASSSASPHKQTRS